MLVFDVKPSPYAVKPQAQSPLEEACDDGLMLSISKQSSLLRIYARNPYTLFNRVYWANEKHLWKSLQTAYDEIDNIMFQIGKQIKDGTALIELEVPRYSIIVQFNMISSNAVFLQKSYQEHMSEVNGYLARQLNNLPKFDTTFTTQNVHLGEEYFNFYFNVSDPD